jgi:hypothetical protein
MYSWFIDSRFRVQRFKVQGSGFWVLGSGFSSAAGCGAASQIGIETLKKRITNIEQGIMNVEVRYSIIIIF